MVAILEHLYGVDLDLSKMPIPFVVELSVAATNYRLVSKSHRILL